MLSIHLSLEAKKSKIMKTFLYERHVPSGRLIHLKVSNHVSGWMLLLCLLQLVCQKMIRNNKNLIWLITSRNCYIDDKT